MLQHISLSYIILIYLFSYREMAAWQSHQESKTPTSYPTTGHTHQKSLNLFNKKQNEEQDLYRWCANLPSKIKQTNKFNPINN